MQKNRTRMNADRADIRGILKAQIRVIQCLVRILFLSLGVLMTFSLLTSGTFGADEFPTIDLWNGIAPGSESFVGEEQTEDREADGLANRWMTGVSRPSRPK